MNWFERIAAAQERGYFTALDKDLANDWVTCACGEQDPQIPRYKVHTLAPRPGRISTCSRRAEPVDQPLFELGLAFAEHVEANDFTMASEVLAAIEQRAAEVLKELDENK